MYEKTHLRIKVAQYNRFIDICRSTIGDNDPYQPFHLRPWFTNSTGEVWIRCDLVETMPLVSYILLQGQP